MKKAYIIAGLLIIVIIVFGCSQKGSSEKTTVQDVQKVQQPVEPAKMTENKSISDEIVSTNELDTAINELDDIE